MTRCSYIDKSSALYVKLVNAERRNVGFHCAAGRTKTHGWECGVALLFLRFWRQTRDRLFLYLSASFLLEAVNRMLFAWKGAHSDAAAQYYLVRLVA